MKKKLSLLLASAVVAGFLFAMLRSAAVYAGTIPELITDYNVNLTDEEVAIMNPLFSNSCALIYVFDNAQSLQSCCGCPLSANGVLDLSVSSDLLGLDSSSERGIIEILPSQPTTFSGKCDPTKSPVGSGAVLQAAEYQLLFNSIYNGTPNLPYDTFYKPAGVGAAKTFFANVTINSSDVSKLTSLCSKAQACSCGGTVN